MHCTYVATYACMQSACTRIKIYNAWLSIAIYMLRSCIYVIVSFNKVTHNECMPINIKYYNLYSNIVSYMPMNVLNTSVIYS